MLRGCVLKVTALEGSSFMELPVLAVLDLSSQQAKLLRTIVSTLCFLQFSPLSLSLLSLAQSRLSSQGAMMLMETEVIAHNYRVLMELEVFLQDAGACCYWTSWVWMTNFYIASLLHPKVYWELLALTYIGGNQIQGGLVTCLLLNSKLLE